MNKTDLIFLRNQKQEQLTILEQQHAELDSRINKMRRVCAHLQEAVELNEEKLL